MSLITSQETINTKIDMEPIIRIEKDYQIVLEWDKASHKYTDNQKSILTDIFEKFQTNKMRTIFFMGFSHKAPSKSASLDFIYELSKHHISALQKTPNIEETRENIVNKPDDMDITNILLSVPFFIGSKYIDKDFICYFWNELNNIYKFEIKNFSGSVSEFFKKHTKKSKTYGKVCFHLVESKEYQYPFSFLATYTKNILDKNTIKHLPLKNALEEYENNSEKLLELLSTINKASSKSKFINDLVKSGEIFYPIGLNPDESYTFLKEIPSYEESGIICKIPNWWRRKSLNPSIGISIGDKKKTSLDSSALLSFNANVQINGLNLTPKEIEALLKEEEGLKFVKGKWIEVDHKKLNQVLEAYDNATTNMSNQDLTIVEALRLQLSSSKILDNKSPVEIGISNGEWLKSVIESMIMPEKSRKVSLTKSFKAQLRDYQQKGLNWLMNMKKLKLGALLADDMGLGKTVQIIALLTKLKKDEKTLLIVPASLVSNWAQELDKFAPSVKYRILHSGFKDDNVIKNTEENEISLGKGQVFITTYSMISKYDLISDTNWDCLIIDEAQAIKNSNTKQSKLTKKIEAKFKIALTGTPIENSLSDLWSIYDFLNKGLLGTSTEFKNFIKMLNVHHEHYNRLKQIISPFMIRRLKTDKSIISDLPDKIEMKSFSDLTKKQIALYQDLVKEIKEKLDNTDEGIGKKGLILASILKFKQICNHPSLYTGSTNINFNDGGKFKRLGEISETIYNNREQIIIFTQFRDSISMIDTFLQDIFMQKGLILHGGTSIKDRKDIVANFQDKTYTPYIILSIKAGGVGLNLTKANHVVHFDRWWNPAIENQATDRAFRIGQDKNVMVHKFVTKGTIEEKIDAIISEKSELADKIISKNSEKWITELSNNELLDLFRLDI